MSPKSSLTGPSGKRQPSKRTITARNEMRFSHLYHEYEEDDHDWSKEKKHKVISRPKPTRIQPCKNSKSSRKRMLAQRTNLENYF